MPNIKAEITLNSHGNWENHLALDGDYEQVKEQIDLFYEKAKLCMDKVIEKEIAYHDGVAKHFRQ